MEQIRPGAYRLFIRFYRQGAMSARWPVHDRVNVTATTPAPIMTLKAEAFQKNRSGLTALLEADGAKLAF